MTAVRQDRATAHRRWLDCDLTGISGVAFSTRIRKDRRLAKLPILLMSGRDEALVAREAKTAGANDFIIKPFRAPELIARARSLLGTVGSA